MGNTVKITKSAVDRVQPGETIWDTEIKGFGLRCQQRDKSYVLKCTLKGRPKWITIGKHGSPFTPEQARDKARAYLVAVKSGIDPAVKESTTARVRIEALCGRYMKEHALPHKKTSSSSTDQKLIDNHIRPLLGKIYVDELTPERVAAFQSSVVEGKTAPGDPIKVQKAQRGGRVVRGGKGVANRALALLSKMMNLAEGWKLRPANSNPVVAVKRFKETPKDRFLSMKEQTRLGDTLAILESKRKTDPYAIAAIRLLVLTGARLGEILNLRWSQVDLQRRLISLPDSKTGPKTIRLSAAATEVIASIREIGGNPYVIVGRREGQRLVNLQKPWSQIRAQAGLDDVRIHDLRHSFASAAIMSGVPLQAVGKLLGHASAATTERYAHLAEDYLAAQSDRIGNVLSQAIHDRKKSL